MPREALEAKQAESLEECGRTIEQALPIAVKSLATNLHKKPLGYLRYGPYWYALKAVLRAGGEDFGPDTNAEMVKTYGIFDGGELNGFLTIIAASEFGDYYDATFFQGTREFDLTDDGEEAWRLEDADMERAAPQ